MYARLSLLALAALASSAWAASLETWDVGVDTAVVDTGDTGVGDTGVFSGLVDSDGAAGSTDTADTGAFDTDDAWTVHDTAPGDTGLEADEPLPLSLDDLPNRTCSKYSLRMTMLDTDHYLDLLVGGMWWNPQLEFDQHYWGTLESIDLWCTKLGAPLRVDVGDIQADVLAARAAAQTAQAAIINFRDADKDELEQMVLQAQCSLTAAAEAVARAKANLAAIPAAQRTGEAYLWRAMETDLADADLVLRYLMALLDRQATACAPAME